MDQPAQIITEPIPTPAPVSASPQTPVLPKKPSKLPLILLVVLTIGIVGISAFWLGRGSSELNPAQPTPTAVPTIPEPTPTPDPTAGWKIYTNQKYGFSTKYPSYLIPNEEKVLDEVRSVRFVYESKPTQIEFMIEKNFIGGWMGRKINEEKITVDGIEGNISLWLNCDSSIAEEWDKCNEQLSVEKYDSATLRGYFEKGNDKWYVSYQGWKKNEKNADEETQKLNQILSTFKFLNQTSDPTANWKTYKNEEYKFLLRYPQTLNLSEIVLLGGKTVHFESRLGLGSPDYFDVGLRTLELNQETTLQKWVEQEVIRELPSGKIGSIVEGEITPYQTSELTGLTYVGMVESIIKYVVFKKNNLIFIFSLSGGETGSSFRENNNSEPIFDQILSTFKFLD